MSANSKINDSPGHFTFLQAIARGLDTVDKIAAATRKSVDEVRAITNDLVNQRLANKREGLFWEQRDNIYYNGNRWFSTRS